MATTPAPPKKQITITWFEESQEPTIIVNGTWSNVQIASLGHLIAMAHRKAIIALNNEQRRKEQQQLEAKE